MREENIQFWKELFEKDRKDKEATMHWDPILQAEFLKELNSMGYLKYWVNKI